MKLIRPDVDSLSLTDKARLAFLEAMETVVQRAKMAGTKIVIMEEGVIKEYPAEEMERRLDILIAEENKKTLGL
jgi:hypothetical protein